MLLDREVQTLTELGLTARQAKVYLVLAERQSLTAKETALISKLARQDVYQVLTELQQRGLIEKQIKTPTEFAAIPIQNACSILLEQRTKDISQLHQKAEELISEHRKDGKLKPYLTGPKIFLIPDGEAFKAKILRGVESARTSIDIVSTSKNAPQGFFFLFEALQKAAKKGVKIRCLTEGIALQKPQFNSFRPLLKNPFFEIRTIPSKFKNRFCVYDKKKLSIVLFRAKAFGKSSLLWTECESLVDAYSEHYEMLWLKATEHLMTKNRAAMA